MRIRGVERNIKNEKGRLCWSEELFPDFVWCRHKGLQKMSSLPDSHIAVAALIATFLEEDSTRLKIEGRIVTKNDIRAELKKVSERTFNRIWDALLEARIIIEHGDTIYVANDCFAKTLNYVDDGFCIFIDEYCDACEYLTAEELKYMGVALRLMPFADKDWNVITIISEQPELARHMGYSDFRFKEMINTAINTTFSSLLSIKDRIINNVTLNKQKQAAMINPRLFYTCDGVHKKDATSLFVKSL